MKFFVILCFSVALFYADSQTANAQQWDYKLPRTNIWTNVHGEGGIKQKIEGMVSYMTSHGTPRSDFVIVTICKHVGSPIPADINSMVISGQWKQLTNTAFRACGSMSNVVFKTKFVRKKQAQSPETQTTTTFCNKEPICTSSNVSIKRVKNNAHNIYCGEQIYRCVGKLTIQ